MHQSLLFSLKAASFALVATALCLAAPAQARDYIEVSGANFKPLPIAVTQTLGDAGEAREFDEALRNDLKISGLFDLLDPKSFLADSVAEGTDASTIRFDQWKAIGADSLIKTRISANGQSFGLNLWLFDVVQGKEALSQEDSASDVVTLAHRAADRIFEQFTGERGMFQTRIAYVKKTGDKKEIWVSDFDGRNATLLTPGGLNILPSWSRDGRKVLFTSYREGRPLLYTVDLASRIVKALYPKGELQTGGVFSPDGSKVALTLSEQGNTDIYVVNADGSGALALTNTREIETSPSWSPDGKRIAFVSTRSGDPQIFAMNADGTSVERVTFQGKYNQTPVWSPRGDVIAFTARDERGVFDLFTVDVQSKKIKRLTQDAGSNEQPTFSPNGRHIIFTSTRTGQKRLWMMNADGTNQHLLPIEGEVATPAWGPWVR